MTDINPSLHIYHAQYLYITLLFWLSNLWPWHGDLDLDFSWYHKITWTKHHINTKTVHLLHFANISDEFEGQWPWWTCKICYNNAIWIKHHIHANAQVSLCWIYCRTWTNVKILKFAPFLLCQSVKSSFYSVGHGSFSIKVRTWKNTTQFYVVFHTNE